MRAVIILGHGSRVPDAAKDMDNVARILKEKYHLDMVETCQMSRSGPHYGEILEKCIQNGAKEVMVIPCFLNKGMHIILDIPEMMQNEASKYPDIKMIYGNYLGFDPSYADILYKRICESENFPDVRTLKLESKEKFPVPPDSACQ
jgi:sirohydrochlorin ferrochelatase